MTDRHRARSHGLRLPVRRLHPDAVLPAYSHPGDAGLDLTTVEETVLDPFRRAAVATGLAVAIPEGYAGFVQPRSGRALREGLGLVNSPGLIDSHYRGELKVVVINMDAHERIVLHKGERIAQLVVQPVASVLVEAVERLEDTPRGEGGFGSTGA